nr:hypothetical protein [Bosea sp. Root483D1]
MMLAVDRAQDRPVRADFHSWVARITGIVPIGLVSGLSPRLLQVVVFECGRHPIDLIFLKPSARGNITPVGDGRSYFGGHSYCVLSLQAKVACDREGKIE